MALNYWQPIEDLPDNWAELKRQDIPPLVTIWSEQSDKLRQSTAYAEFTQRLQRRLAIETGVIENLYDLDRGVTQILIEKGIEESLIPHGSTNRLASQVVDYVRDHQAAMTGLFDFVTQRRQLSTSYIKSLHQLLTRHQDYAEGVDIFKNKVRFNLLRGEWKQTENNPTRPNGEVYFYCPPLQVQPQMEQLITWHIEHTERNVSPEIEAAWLHHRFTQIHPFQDGNGRVARCLASLVFIRTNWFPLVITRDERSSYIDALEDADAGNLKPLVDLFASVQRQQFVSALSLSEQVLEEGANAQSIISAAAAKIRQQRTRTTEQIRIQVETLANQLLSHAYSQVQNIATQIRNAMTDLPGMMNVTADMTHSNEEAAGYYRYQIIVTARELDYYANLETYRSWARLKIQMKEVQVEILLSFHVMGREFRGLMACSACAFKRILTDDQESRNAIDIKPLSLSPFNFSYADENKDALKRFQTWLDSVLVVGLEYWRKGL
jgi:Fic family protein